jgi:hypothetical protein
MALRVVGFSSVNQPYYRFYFRAVSAEPLMVFFGWLLDGINRAVEDRRRQGHRPTPVHWHATAIEIEASYPLPSRNAMLLACACKPSASASATAAGPT